MNKIKNISIALIIFFSSLGIINFAMADDSPCPSCVWGSIQTCRQVSVAYKFELAENLKDRMELMIIGSFFRSPGSTYSVYQEGENINLNGGGHDTGRDLVVIDKNSFSNNNSFLNILGKDIADDIITGEYSTSTKIYKAMKWDEFKNYLVKFANFKDDNELGVVLIDDNTTISSKAGMCPIVSITNPLKSIEFHYLITGLTQNGKVILNGIEKISSFIDGTNKTENFSIKENKEISNGEENQSTTSQNQATTQKRSFLSKTWQGIIAFIKKIFHR